MKTFYDKRKLKELLATEVAQHMILEGMRWCEKEDKHNTGGKINTATFIRQKSKKFSNTERLTK